MTLHITKELGGMEVLEMFWRHEATRVWRCIGLDSSQTIDLIWLLLRVVFVIAIILSCINASGY